MQITRAVLDAIASHARRDYPRECCGLLIGGPGDVVEAIAMTNVAADPLRRYEVSAAEHFALVRRCRGNVASGLSRKLQIVGVYHSHPHSAPVPSPTDAEQAFANFLYLIAGPVGADADVEIRAYTFEKDRFTTVALFVVP